MKVEVEEHHIGVYTHDGRFRNTWKTQAAILGKVLKGVLDYHS